MVPQDDDEDYAYRAGQGGHGDEQAGGDSKSDMHGTQGVDVTAVVQGFVQQTACGDEVRINESCEKPVLNKLFFGPGVEELANAHV